VWPQDRAGDYPHLCGRHKPGDPQVPVLVTYTYQHVVWVGSEALTGGAGMPVALKAARNAIEPEAYEHTDLDNLAHADWRATVPTATDYRLMIYGNVGHPGGGRLHDAHVTTHRAHLAAVQLAAEREQCAAAGHPIRHAPRQDGTAWCRGCRAYLPAAVVAELRELAARA
jgi:hypothetical protein